MLAECFELVRVGDSRSIVVSRASSAHTHLFCSLCFTSQTRHTLFFLILSSVGTWLKGYLSLYHKGPGFNLRVSDEVPPAWSRFHWTIVMRGYSLPSGWGQLRFARDGDHCEELGKRLVLRASLWLRTLALKLQHLFVAPGRLVKLHIAEPDPQRSCLRKCGMEPPNLHLTSFWVTLLRPTLETVSTLHLHPKNHLQRIAHLEMQGQHLGQALANCGLSL